MHHFHPSEVSYGSPGTPRQRPSAISRSFAKLAVFAALSAALITGCGGQGSGSQEAFKTYPSGGYFNGNPVPATLTIASPLGKKLDLAAGDSVAAPPIRAAILVKGCTPSPVPEIGVCWETDDLQQPAERLAPELPSIVSNVERVVGPTGAVDILLARSGTSIYTGYYNNGPSGKRTVVVAETSDFRIMRIITGHELAHAAYQKAGGDLEQVWLNEAVATMVESEMGWIRAIPAPGTFNNTGLTAKPVDEMDYYRTQRIGLLLKKFGRYPLGSQLSRKDPVLAISGMEVREFAREFWREQIVHAPLVSDGKVSVPPYGGVRITAPASGPDLFELMTP